MSCRVAFPGILLTEYSEPSMQPKRRRSSAQPALGGSSERVAQPQVSLIEESEPEEEEQPARKVGRTKKLVSEHSLNTQISRLHDFRDFAGCARSPSLTCGALA